MKNLYAILFLLMTAISPATAQLDFGIKVGVNLSHKPTELNSVKEIISERSGWYAGPTIKYIFPVVGIGLEANVLYAQSNMDVEGNHVQTRSIEVPLYLRYELTIPVINKYFEPFIAAGPQFNWNIGDKVFTWENIGEYTKQIFDMQGSSIGLNLGGGAVLFDCIQLHVNYNIALGKTADYSSISGLVHNIHEAKINKWQLSATYLF